MNRLLTIGIPTYNRSQSLNLMLNALSNDIRSFEYLVEVLILDNHSSDDTSQIVHTWSCIQSPRLQTRYIRHSENIGLSRNVVSLFYEATSEYLIILGDDDRLNSENFPKVIYLLMNKRPSAVIQALWNGAVRGGVGALNFDRAMQLFYEYGNAWAGIVNRNAAVRAIESRDLRVKVEQIVWPQTVFGFLAMFDLIGESEIEAVGFEIGGPLIESLNITNKAYWIRSLYDLLSGADIVQKHTSNKFLAKFFVAFNSYGFLLHIKSILWYTLLDSDRTPISNVSCLLRRRFGFRGWLWSFLLNVDRSIFLLRILYAINHRLMKCDKKKSLQSRIYDSRLKREAELSGRAISGKRFGDWF